MATSLRQWTKLRATNQAVYFLLPTEASPPTSGLTPSAPQPTASFEEKTFNQVPDFVLLTSADGTPWAMRVDATGALETVNARLNNVAGYGIAGLSLRGSTFNTLAYAVSNAGVLSITNTAAPTTGYILPIGDYVQGSQRVNYSWADRLAYRADTRIHPHANTHSPKSGAPLISPLRLWRGEVAEPEPEFDERWW